VSHFKLEAALLGGEDPYRYAPDPVNWVDPLGLVCKGGGAGATLAARSSHIGASPTAERQAIAQSFYRKAGFKESSIADHVRGIDFNRPVDIVTLPKGTELIQYQIPGAPIGNYFALPGTPGNQLGFYTSGRQATTFVATEDMLVLRSTAASTVDDWSMKAHGWKIDTPGGGLQFFSPSKAWKPK